MPRWRVRCSRRGAQRTAVLAGVLLSKRPCSSLIALLLPAAAGSSDSPPHWGCSSCVEVGPLLLASGGLAVLLPVCRRGKGLHYAELLPGCLCVRCRFPWWF